MEQYKILFIDDDKIDRMAFERFARRETFPYDYIIAGSIEGTRDILKSNRFDVVVMDYFLGDGTAFELFEDLKGTPIIIVTGIGTEEIAVNAMKTGAYDYLIKDAEGNYLKTLPLTVENTIRRKQAEEELYQHRTHLEELVELRTAELRQEIEERKRIETQLQTSLQEKEVLLKEIHHRVKNNLQIISSLLNLQADGIQDPLTLEILRINQNRIRSMALVHEQLYQSEDFARINFAEYIRHLIDEIFVLYGAAIVKSILNINSGGETILDIDTALRCGLIISELISNTLKHAFPDGKSGEIRVDFQIDAEETYTLTVGDNGIGLPENLDIEQTQSLGLRLVQILTHQLKGTVRCEGEHGTVWKISFPRM